MSEAPNRRPIRSRTWSVFRNAAARLASAGVTPNAISLASIVFGVAAGAALAATSRAEGETVVRLLWLAGALLVQLRLICNLLDGLVAVEGGKQTPGGELYNEAPDRIADTAVLIGGGCAAGGSPALGAAAALVAMFVAYVRALGASTGVGQVFTGPMAKPHRMAIVTAIAMISSAAPRVSIDFGRIDLGLISIALVVVIVGGLVTAGRRLREIARRLNRQESD